MQAHDFFENFLFNGRQLHFSEASGMRFRHVHKEFIALLDVPSDRWSLDRAGDLVAWFASRTSSLSLVRRDFTCPTCEPSGRMRRWPM